MIDGRRNNGYAQQCASDGKEGAAIGFFFTTTLSQYLTSVRTIKAHCCQFGREAFPRFVDAGAKECPRPTAAGGHTCMASPSPRGTMEYENVVVGLLRRGAKDIVVVGLCPRSGGLSVKVSLLR